MIKIKILKFKHFLKSKLLENSSLKKLNQSGLEGSLISQAFLETANCEFNSKKDKQLFEKLNQYKLELYANNNNISFEEIGSAIVMKVNEIAHRASSSEIWKKFFYNLSKKNNVKNILEVGTNLGISGQYFIKALEDKKKTKFITLEGVKELCKIASERFNSISTEERFEIIQGLYDETLPKLIKKNISFDLVFIDGNHRYESTLKYFELIKNNLSDGCLVIFDDINWSRGMSRAWQDICKQQGIVFSINFFKLGMIVFDPKKSKPTNDHYELFLSS